MNTLVIWLAVACSALSATLAIRDIRRGRRSPEGLSTEALKLNAGMICCALVVGLTALVSPRYPTIGNSLAIVCILVLLWCFFSGPKLQ